MQRLKRIHTTIENAEIQKSHPFGFSESRFKWVNKYFNGNDLNYHKKFFRRSVDDLEGGIGHYFSKIKKENEKKMKQNLLTRYINNVVDMKKCKYKYQSVNSQRVIYPERDTEIGRTSKKKTYENSKSNLFNSTNGKISSLFLSLASLRNRSTSSSSSSRKMYSPWMILIIAIVLRMDVPP